MSNYYYLLFYSFVLSPSPDRSHQVKVVLRDSDAKESDLGYISVQVEVNTQQHHEEVNLVKESCHSLRHASGQFWKSTVSITLLGAKGLPAMDQNGMHSCMLMYVCVCVCVLVVCVCMCWWCMSVCDAECQAKANQTLYAGF